MCSILSVTMNTLTVVLFILTINKVKTKIPALQQKKIQFNCLGKLLGETWQGKEHVVIASRNEALRPLRLPYIYLNEKNAIEYLAQEVDKPNAYTIIPDTIDSLENILMAITQSPSFRIARYTVFVDKDIDVEELAQVMWNYRLPNTLIFQTNFIYKIEIFDCAQAKALMVEFNCNTATVLPEFSFKKNFLNCPLKVIWSRYQPFVYPLNNTWGWKGIFMDLLEPFAYISQRHLTYTGDDTDYVEEVGSAFSYSLIIQDMVNETQLYVGSSELRTSGIFELSPVLTDDDLMVLTPRALRDYWNNFRKLVRRDLFFFAMVTLSGMAATLYLLGRVEDGSNHQVTFSWMEIAMFLWGVMLGAGYPGRLSRFWFLRLFIGVILLVSMVINFYMQGSLVNAMTGSVYDAPITNPRQLVESGLPLMVRDLVYQTLAPASVGDEKLMFKNFQSAGDTIMLVLMEKAVEQRNFATLAIKAFLLQKPNIKEAFGLFPIGNLQLCLAMKKNDYSAPEMSRWIGLLVQSGFVEKFKNLHLDRMSWKFSVKLEEKHFVLGMKQFWPVLVFWAWGLSIAVGCFILEIIVYRFKKSMRKI